MTRKKAAKEEKTKRKGGASERMDVIEEETDRREGKGRRCCLGDGIHSIPCRTTDFAQG